MAITAVLVDSGPNWLRYLCTQDGVVSSPPVEADGLVIIPNAGGATPDLRTDALTGCANAGAGSVGGSGLLQIMRARIDGYGPLVAGVALTQAQALALLQGLVALAAPLDSLLLGVCYSHVQQRTGVIAWRLSADIDGDGDPVMEVRSQTGTPGTAYVDIMFQHSKDR